MVLSIQPRSPAVLHRSETPSGSRGALMNLDVAVLAEWYASHSVVRRLWAIEEPAVIRIIVTLEPTLDSDDTEPAWLANSWRWAHELEFRAHRSVRLEMINDPSHIASVCDLNALIAAISWRDPEYWTSQPA